MHYNDLVRQYYETAQGADQVEDKDFRPLYAIDYKKDDEILKYLTDCLSSLQVLNESRMQNQVTNIQFYKGIHTLANNSNIRTSDYDNQPITMENRFVMNHILELTHQKQSRLMKFAPNLSVTPWNNEYALKLGARLGKKIVDSTFYVHDIDSILAELTLEAAICGESFLFVEWDKYAGDKDPDVAKAKARQAKGLAAKFIADDGKEIKLSEIETIGDHKYDHPLPFLVLHEPRTRWRDVNYIFKGTVKHIDQIRAENHDLSEEKIKTLLLKSQDNAKDAASAAPWGKFVIEWEFYHRKHRFVPEGWYAKFYNGILVTHGKLPYTHGELPVARFTDYDDPTNAHGRSFYEDLKLPSVMINNMMKVAYRSFCIAAYPKLLMPKDSCNMYSMANGPFVVEYTQGMDKPQIVSFNAVNKDFFPLSDHVERFMEKNSGTFAMSRGEAMPNARARSILNFYEEQEQQRESAQIRKYTAMIGKIGRLSLAVAADFFKQEDGRTIRIVGKRNQYKLQKIKDTTKLSGPYDVKAERTTALSESKQGRIDQITALSQMPLAEDGSAGLFTREQILQMIELADTPTFFEASTAAVERAQSENEDMFEGMPVPPPTEWQAHLIDWNEHFQFMQSKEFSDTAGLPEDVVKAYKNHLRTHEMMLYEKAKYNLTLAQILMANKYFPAVYKISPTDLPLSQIVLLLQQPPMPPLPPGGDPAALPPEGEAPVEGDVPAGDAIPPADAAPVADNPPMEEKPKKKRVVMTDSDGSQKSLDIEEMVM